MSTPTENRDNNDSCPTPWIGWGPNGVVVCMVGSDSDKVTAEIIFGHVRWERLTGVRGMSYSVIPAPFHAADNTNEHVK